MLTLDKNAIPRRRLLRTKEAAEYLSLSPWKLRRLTQEGRLPVVQDADGSPFLFDLRDLDGYIDRNKRLSPR
jgi:excisionase family DNA binding protein